MTGSGSGPPTGPAAFASASLWIVDLDGVVWLSGKPIGDVQGAIATLRSRGIRVVFATNNSAPTTAELLSRLDAFGVSAGESDLISSAGAAASLVEPGQPVRVLGESGLLEALERRGVEIREEGRSGIAVIGWSRSFDFDSLASIASAARSSGRLVATNEDPTHPTPEGLLPGAGALLAAVTTASGVRPEVAGKPHSAMVQLMSSKFGFDVGDRSVVMVGDQPRTDGKLAERLEIPFGLVDSGVTSADVREFEVAVDVRYPDFVTMVRTVFG
jgi:HAD superfamily hydrolase (TIGR01450 family)